MIKNIGVALCIISILDPGRIFGQFVEFANWKNNAVGAYSVIHDDYGNAGVDGIWKIADSLYMERGLNFTFGAISNNCEARTNIDNKGTSAYAKAVDMIMRGHEMINHSHNHTCASEGYWNCSSTSKCCWGIPGDPNEDMATNIDKSHESIEKNTKIAPQFFIYPYDVFSLEAENRLNAKGYLGARTGSKRSYENSNFGPKLGDYFQTNFLVFTDSNSWSDKHDSILNIPIDHVLKTGGWANRELHNVGHGGWGFVRPDQYAKHLDYVKEKVDEGKLWVATISEVLVYQLQKHGFKPIPSYDTLNKNIVIDWEVNNPELGSRIEALFYKSPITVNVKLNEFKFNEIKINQAGKEITNFKVKNKLLSINCFPHHGQLKIAVDGLATHIEQRLNLTGLVVYNNRFSNSTILKFNDGTLANFEVFLMNSSGKLVERKNWHSQQPLAIGHNLSPGFYLLKLAKDSNSKTIKIIR